MNATFGVRRVGRMHRLLLGGTATVMLTIALTVSPTGPVGVSSVHAGDGELGPRLAAACARIPAAEKRLEAVIVRLDADASQRGSLAWFRVAVARAESNDRPQLAADLERRLGRLSERRTALDERRRQLDRLVTICAERTAQG